MKALFWVGSARDDVTEFPEDARRMAGHQLHCVQMGLEPDDWKPMPAVGTGVCEIRIHTEVEHRGFYIAKFAEAVYVLHAFEKKTQRTRQTDVEEGEKLMSPRKIARSSGNVFEDLGYSREEAEYLRIRSALMATLGELITRRGWTQGQAAKLLGVTQPRVSDLMRGKIDLFSIDTLVDMLSRAGCRVELRVAQPV